MEKEYRNFCPSAKKGINKYCGLSSKGMAQYRTKYKNKTGKRATAISNKEDFYSFVARSKLRR